MTWRNNLKEQVAVTVANGPWSDLQIRPGQATISKGQALKYEVTAVKGGQLRVLGPDQGLQLVVGDANVAQVLDDLSVGAKQEGRTTVVAKFGALAPRPPWMSSPETPWPPGSLAAASSFSPRGSRRPTAASASSKAAQPPMRRPRRT